MSTEGRKEGKKGKEGRGERKGAGCFGAREDQVDQSPGSGPFRLLPRQPEGDAHGSQGPSSLGTHPGCPAPASGC